MGAFGCTHAQLRRRRCSTILGDRHPRDVAVPIPPLDYCRRLILELRPSTVPCGHMPHRFCFLHQAYGRGDVRITDYEARFLDETGKVAEGEMEGAVRRTREVERRVPPGTPTFSPHDASYSESRQWLRRGLEFAPGASEGKLWRRLTRKDFDAHRARLARQAGLVPPDANTK